MAKIKIETINQGEKIILKQFVPEQNKVQKGQLLWLGIVQKKVLVIFAMGAIHEWNVILQMNDYIY